MRIEFGCEATKKKIIKEYPHTAQVLSEGGNLIIAIDDSNQLLGFLWSFRREVPAPISGKLEDFINVIEIFGDNQRKGIGSALVQKCIEKSTADGIYQVRAYCETNNVASHHLWVKNKFGISPVKMHDGNIYGSFVTFVI